MILIADSGATKTEWRIIKNKDEIEQAITPGINPHYMSSEQILLILEEAILKGGLQRKIREIHFYGAGCSSQDKVDHVKSALEYTFIGSTIEVHSDIVGVARALCGHYPGIISIMGTGSAACQFDGHAIEHQIPSLGFILGDEGSGAHLGKLLVSAYLRGEFPETLVKPFEEEFKLTKESVLDEVNNGKTPSRFLGKFAVFMGKHLNDHFIHQLVYMSFSDFLKKYVEPLPAARESPLHFSGGVAYYFSSILKSACQDLNLSVGKVVQSPIAGLTLYHLGEI